jgi:hypothetical protein
MGRQFSRSLTAVGVAAVLVVGVGGFAYGATGGSFLLGKSNKAGGSTSLTNTGSGVALKLFTKSSLSAPFSTNAKGRVVNLYADRANIANAASNSTRLGGQTLSQVLASVQPVALTCAQGGACVVGNTGPGNGTVFYDAGSMQSWGRYLEAAPNTWSGDVADPTLPWCLLNGSALNGGSPLVGAPGTAFGTGWANTERAARYCDSGAAVSTRGYHGGGEADWFLPSTDELNQLCRWARALDTSSTASCQTSFDDPTVGGFTAGNYWSSTELSSGVANQIWFVNGGLYNTGMDSAESVRPIRAF